jgi:hypothetical protein
MLRISNLGGKLKPVSGSLPVDRLAGLVARLTGKRISNGKMDKTPLLIYG